MQIFHSETSFLKFLWVEIERFSSRLVFLAFFVGWVCASGVVQAETVGDTLQIPITFTASEAVTAADFTVSIDGGTLVNVECGGSGFNNLTSSSSHCVLFNTNGATSGTIALVTVNADRAGTLSVTVSGTLSTAQGEEPSSGSINGATYDITSASAATSTPTPTTLLRSGMTSNTFIFSLFTMTIFLSGLVILRKT